MSKKITVVTRRNAKSILRALEIQNGIAHLPTNTIKIEKDAFKEVDFSSFGIKMLVTNDELVKIESNAFIFAKLEKLYIKKRFTVDNLYLENGTFYCTQIDTIIIERFMENIPSKCFSRSRTRKIDIEVTGCNRIGSEAFKECGYLEEIILPKNYYEIEHDAFSRTSSLEKIELRTSIIPSEAFNGSGLKEIQIKCKEFVGVEIKDCAFYQCLSLKTVETDTPIIEIGASAFHSCGNLGKIDLSHTKFIGVSAFVGASSLREIDLSSIKDLGEFAFEDCCRLNKIIIGNNLNEIPNGAFNDCEDLENIKLSSDTSNIKAIGNQAFKNCKRLKCIWFKDLEYIGEEAFSGCRELREISFSNVHTIEKKAFEYCIGLTEVISDVPINKIGECAFFECINLQNIEIYNPDEMGSNVFSKCWNLQSIKFLSNLKGE